MLPKITIYKSALNDSKEIVLQTTTSELTLSKAIFACKELHGQHVVAFVNNVQVAGDDWYSYRLEMNDNIRIMPEPGLSIAGAFIGAMVGAYGTGALTAGTYIFHAVVLGAMLKGAAIGYALGSTLDALINPPTMPVLPTLGDDKTDPSYSWSGPQMVTQPEGPVSATYGQFLIGGTLIMQNVLQGSWYETTDTAQVDLSPDNHAAVTRGRTEKLATAGWNGWNGAVISAVTELCNSDYPPYLGNYSLKTYQSDEAQKSGIEMSSTFATVTGHKYKVSVAIAPLKTYQKIRVLWTCGDGSNTISGKRSGWIHGASNGINFYNLEWIFTETHGGNNAKVRIYVDVTAWYDPEFDTAKYAKIIYYDKIEIKEWFPSSDNYLNMLINLGEGPIEGIMKSDLSGVCISKNDVPYILLNGQPLENFQDISWDYRLGTWNQSVIDHFHETTTYYSEDRKIIKGTPITYTGVGAGIEGFEVQLTVPSLFAINSQGDMLENSIVYKLEYRIIGAGAWIDDGEHTITGKSKTQIYAYVKKSNLTSGQYEIKVTRITPEYTGLKKSGDLYLSGITEIDYENIAYRNSALLALQLKATSQLSGTTPNITTMIRGKTVLVPDLQISSVTQTYDDCYWDDNASVYKRISDDATCTDTSNFVQQWTRNPIWNTKDFIINKRYGLGEYIESTDWDNAAAIIEARYCWQLVTDFDGGTEHRFEMNLPISRFMSAPSVNKLLSRCFRGNIIWSNGKYKPVVDRSRTPVQLFNESNIIPDSLKTTYLKASKIPNFVEVQYADPARNYNVDILEIVDEDEWTSVKPLRRETLNARGTTRASECLRTGRYYLNCGKYVTKAHEFVCDLDAIHCEPGDTVQVNNDLLAWGVGGRVITATNNSITTNIDITYAANYKIRARLSDGTLETKTVTSVSNNNRTINISGAFTSIPLADSVFAYGATDVDSKPFKVKQMTLIEHNKCKLILAEENANKYNDTTGVSLPDPIYTILPNPTDPPENVTDLTLSEMNNKPGFYISFNIPRECLVFSYADVHLSLDSSEWWAYRTGVTENSNIEVLGTKPGQIYYVKVVAYNRLGVANLSPAIASITIADVGFIPMDINGLRLDGEITATEFTKRDAKFVWRKGSPTAGAGHFGAGQENLGAGTWHDDVYYKYWVEIHVNSTMVRKEIIADNAYVYTYEKNLADNGTASNSFTIKVWGFNEAANKRSANPATLAVTNPAPTNPQNLISAVFILGVAFKWNIASEIDFDYWSYQYKICTRGLDDGSWTDWINTKDNIYSHKLSDTEIAAYGNTADIYFRIVAYDTFGNASSQSSTQNQTLSIDGAYLTLDTLNATHINGAGFGNLTISSGKLSINTTDALEIMANGNIKILDGGDIILNQGGTIYGLSTIANSPVLILTNNVASPTWTNKIYQLASGQLYIDTDAGDINIRNYEDGNNYSWLQLSRAAYEHWDLTAKNAGRYVEFIGRTQTDYEYLRLYDSHSGASILVGYLGVELDKGSGKVKISSLSSYANNAAAIAGGLSAGHLYRTGGDPDSICVVH